MAFVELLSLPLLLSLLGKVFAVFIAWVIGTFVFNRFFHPLAPIPGPFWASISHLYIVKYNLFSGRSQFYLQLEKLHEKYGPVVRVSPDEIHLSDPDNYEKVYYIGSKAPSRSSYFYDAFGLKTAAFGTTSNELHRVRRAALTPLFSRKAVLELEAVVQSKASKLIARVKDAISKEQPVDLHHGFRALAVDVITDYAFGNCYNQLDKDNFAADFFEMTSELAPRGWLLQAFPILLPISEWVTLGMAKRMNIYLYNFLQFRTRCVNEIKVIKKDIDSGNNKSSRHTIFHQLLDPNATEGHVVPDVEDLTDEAFTILSAAADTTGHAMATTTYYILRDPSIYAALSNELSIAFPSSSQVHPFLTLEKLPYLTGCIKEGLRLSYGVPGRLPRTIETDSATFNGYTVPKGTIVGMSSWMMHRDERIWPEPEKFKPERWLEPSEAKRLDKYLVAFTKGSRQCIGMQLAYAEIYITIGSLFHTFPSTIPPPTASSSLSASSSSSSLLTPTSSTNSISSLKPNPSLKIYKTTDKDLEFEDYFGAFFFKEARKFMVARADE